MGMVWDEYANLERISGVHCLEQSRCRSLRRHPGALLKLQRGSRGVGHEGAAGETVCRLNARYLSLSGILPSVASDRQKKSVIIT